MILYFLSIPLPSTAKVPAIIVFGDSTVDTGNNNHINTVLRSNFPPYGRDFNGGMPTGRFGNGRLAPDFIAEALGLGPIVPAYLDPAYSIKDFATAVCFASAGTGLDTATSDVLKRADSRRSRSTCGEYELYLSLYFLVWHEDGLRPIVPLRMLIMDGTNKHNKYEGSRALCLAHMSVIPLWKEVEYFKDYQRKLRAYLGPSKAKETVSEAVYIISIGSNDFLENYFAFITGRFNQFTVEQFEDFLISIAANFVTDIYLLGARKISFSGLGPIGCLPLERTTNFLRGSACIEEYNKVAMDFNWKLQAMVVDLCVKLPGLRLRYSNVYDPLHAVIRNPSYYGFENVNLGCCATGEYELGYLCNEWSPFTCKDADKYFFWDSFHPTERVNRFAAQFALNGSLAEFR